MQQQENAIIYLSRKLVSGLFNKCLAVFDDISHY